MPGGSLNPDASTKYWNEVWLDELIEEAFRLTREKVKDLKEEVVQYLTPSQ